MDTRSPQRSYRGAATRPTTASWDQKRTATPCLISYLERGITLQPREWFAIKRNTVAEMESHLLCQVSELKGFHQYGDRAINPTIFQNTTVSQYPHITVCPVYNMLSDLEGNSIYQAANELRTIWNASVNRFKISSIYIVC